MSCSCMLLRCHDISQSSKYSAADKRHSETSWLRQNFSSCLQKCLWEWKQITSHTKQVVFLLWKIDTNSIFKHFCVCTPESSFSEKNCLNEIGPRLGETICFFSWDLKFPLRIPIIQLSDLQAHYPFDQTYPCMLKDIHNKLIDRHTSSQLTEFTFLLSYPIYHPNLDMCRIILFLIFKCTKH